jgi:cytochrome b
VSAPNLALRFLLELSALAALGYWGAHLGAGLPLRIGLALAAPLAAALAWGAVVSPKARVRATAPTRLATELAIFGAAGWALAAAGQPRWATAFGAAVGVHELWRAAERRAAGPGARAR